MGKKFMNTAVIVLWLANGAAAQYFYFCRDYLFYSAFLASFLIFGIVYTIRIVLAGKPFRKQILHIAVFWLPLFPSLFAERFIPAHGVFPALFLCLRIVLGGILIWGVATICKKIVAAVDSLQMKVVKIPFKSMQLLAGFALTAVPVMVSVLLAGDLLLTWLAPRGTEPYNLEYDSAHCLYHAKHYIFYHIPFLPDQDHAYVSDWQDEIENRPPPFQTCPCRSCNGSHLNTALRSCDLAVNEEFGAFLMMKPEARELQRSVHGLWLETDRRRIQFGRTWTPRLHICEETRAENKFEYAFPYLESGKYIAVPHIFRFDRKNDHYIAAVAMPGYGLEAYVGKYDLHGCVELHIWKNRKPFAVYKLVEYNNISPWDDPYRDGPRSSMDVDGVIHLVFSPELKFAIPIFTDKAKVVPKVIKAKMINRGKSFSGGDGNGSERA